MICYDDCSIKNTYTRIKNCGRRQATSEDSRDSGYAASNGDTRRISGHSVYSPAKVSDEEDSVDDEPTITTPDTAMHNQTGDENEYDTDIPEQWIPDPFENFGGKVCSSTVSEVSNTSEGLISSSHELAKPGRLGQGKNKALQQLRLLQLPNFELATEDEEMKWDHSNPSHRECFGPTQEAVKNQPTYSQIVGVAIFGIALLLVSPWFLLLLLHVLNDILWLIAQTGN